MQEVRNPCFIVFFQTDKPGYLVRIYKSTDGKYSHNFSFKEFSGEKCIKAIQLKEIKTSGEKSILEDLIKAEVPIRDISKENEYCQFLENILFLEEDELNEKLL